MTAWAGWAVALRWLADAAAVVRAETKQGELVPPAVALPPLCCGVPHVLAKACVVPCRSVSSAVFILCYVSTNPTSGLRSYTTQVPNAWTASRKAAARMAIAAVVVACSHVHCKSPSGADLGVSLRTLYRDAGAPGFLGARPGDASLAARLCSHVARLPEARAAGLSCRLRGAAAAVRGGEAAAAADLMALEVNPYPCQNPGLCLTFTLSYTLTPILILALWSVRC